MRLLSQLCNSTSTPTGSSLTEFKLYTEEEIMEIIKSMPTKSCESDAFATQVLKGILPLIITPLTTLINLALEEGIFTETWKVAIIWPLIKKLGFELVYSNYRHVTNLPFLSKVVEKCLLKQFNIHCGQQQSTPRLSVCQQAKLQHRNGNNQIVQ